MGVMIATLEHNHSPEQIAKARAYREQIVHTGRFLTFCGGAAPLGFRLRPDPAQRAALRLVRETDAGVVLSGRIGMHTSPAYAEDVYVGALNGIQIDGPPGELYHPGRRPGGDDAVPQTRDPRHEPVHGAAQQPLR